MTGRLRMGLVAAVVALAACAPAESAVPEPVEEAATLAPLDAAPPAAPATTAAPTTTTVAPPPSSSSTTTASTPTTTAAALAEAAAAPRPPAFSSAITEIDEATAARMQASWREGCPVGLADLRLVTVVHWDFDGAPAVGEVVVHRDAAAAIVQVFRELFRAGYPIERMELVDVYDADDDRSMAANNTSAFNCRSVAGTSRWSEHAFGRALDLNPLYNPYVRGGTVDPPDGAAYADRTVDHPAIITAGSPVVAAFAAAGWEWGGAWSSAKDYQHFSESGR